MCCVGYAAWGMLRGSACAWVCCACCVDAAQVLGEGCCVLSALLQVEA